MRLWLVLLAAMRELLELGTLTSNPVQRWLSSPVASLLPRGRRHLKHLPLCPRVFLVGLVMLEHAHHLL